MTDEAMKTLRDTLLNAGIPKVYIGDLPELQLDCVAIKAVPGYPNTMYFGQTDVLEPLISVSTRASEFATGESISTLAMKTLNQYSNKNVGILQARVTGSPGFLGKNAKGFYEWHCVVHVTLTDY